MGMHHVEASVHDRENMAAIEAHESAEVFPVAAIEAHDTTEVFPVAAIEAHDTTEVFPVAAIEAHDTTEVFPVAAIEAHDTTEVFPVAAIEAHDSTKVASAFDQYAQGLFTYCLSRLSVACRGGQRRAGHLHHRLVLGPRS